ncbi:hypothetical protein EVAR_26715_1 [Eumeta japonica]|uniref:Uncharacterized protein n=1 Tax=Eumeta variegata TaxID=151549 RepID=A0A4C1XAT8_EUMVA|nr:hypothetical protein EVAR_26715_1 [Eumeta japonica]
MGRYVSTNEALWRLLSFQIHERYPTVVHLAVHLENGQRVYFTEANAAQRAERPPSTTLTSFFAMCEADPFAATLMYVEMPKYYTWNQSTKKFQRRKQGTPVPDWPQVFSTDALGRMYTVHPRNDECFICDCCKVQRNKKVSEISVHVSACVRRNIHLRSLGAIKPGTHPETSTQTKLILRSSKLKPYVLTRYRSEAAYDRCHQSGDNVEGQYVLSEAHESGLVQPLYLSPGILFYWSPSARGAVYLTPFWTAKGLRRIPLGGYNVFAHLLVRLSGA